MKQQSISDSVFALVQAYRIAMRSGLKAQQLGLNAMHVSCLSFIAASHHCTANDIVNHFSRDKAQIARLLKEMIEKDWLRKTANPEDKRSQLLSLTNEGQALASLIKETQSKVQSQMCQNLSDQQIEEFETLAKMMVGNLNEMGR